MDYLSPVFMIVFTIISILVFAVLLGREEDHDPKERFYIFIAGSTYLAIVLFLLRMVAHEIK